MTTAVIFQITDGQFALKVVDTAAVGYLSTWQAPGGKTVATAALSDYDPGSTTFMCQVTHGALTAEPDTTTIDIPATFCDPAKTIPNPGLTAFSVEVSFLQDPQVAAGLSRYLYDNDAVEAYFLLGFAGTGPPKAIGRVRLNAATIGGDARAVLTADIVLPCSTKPDVAWGAVVVTPPKNQARPGSVYPAEPTVTASDATNAAKLAGLGYVAVPTTNWTTAQKITIGTFDFNWSGTAWAAGAHA